MPFFEVKKKEYPGSAVSAANLAKRFQPALVIAVARTMLRWVRDDRKPGRQEVELVGSAQNAEMIADVKCDMGDDVSVLLIDSLQITRCWVAVRKCGYKEMRDECFSQFVEEIEQAIARRK